MLPTHTLSQYRSIRLIIQRCDALSQTQVLLTSNWPSFGRFRSLN